MEDAILRVLAYAYPDSVDATRLRSYDWVDLMRDAEKEIKGKMDLFPSQHATFGDDRALEPPDVAKASGHR